MLSKRRSVAGAQGTGPQGAQGSGRPSHCLPWPSGGAVLPGAHQRAQGSAWPPRLPRPSPFPVRTLGLELLPPEHTGLVLQVWWRLRAEPGLRNQRRVQVERDTVPLWPLGLVSVGSALRLLGLVSVGLALRLLSLSVGSALRLGPAGRGGVQEACSAAAGEVWWLVSFSQGAVTLSGWVWSVGAHPSLCAPRCLRTYRSLLPSLTLGTLGQFPSLSGWARVLASPHRGHTPEKATSKEGRLLLALGVRGLSPWSLGSAASDRAAWQAARVAQSRSLCGDLGEGEEREAPG